MSNQRSILELLELMLKHRDKFVNGLCRWINMLHFANIISIEERDILAKYIYYNRPKYNIINVIIYKGLLNNPSKIWSMSWYWKCGKIKPRIQWIKLHIKKLKKQNQNQHEI